MQCIRTLGSVIANGVLIYLLLATFSELMNCQVYTQLHAVIAFYVDGEAKENDG